jgi:hypothetical protein
MVLDVAYTDERLLIARLEALFGARVHRVKVRRVDLVEATTTVEVRFELLDAAAAHVSLVRDHEIGAA